LLRNRQLVKNVRRHAVTMTYIAALLSVLSSTSSVLCHCAACPVPHHSRQTRFH
jgi:hypothetical protein